MQRLGKCLDQKVTMVRQQSTGSNACTLVATAGIALGDNSFIPVVTLQKAAAAMDLMPADFHVGKRHHHCICTIKTSRERIKTTVHQETFDIALSLLKEICSVLTLLYQMVTDVNCITAAQSGKLLRNHLSIVPACFHTLTCAYLQTRCLNHYTQNTLS